MKYLSLIVILFFVSYSSIFSQETNALRVKGKGYEGYIFPKNHFIFGLDFDGAKSRITLSKENGQRAEAILNDSIDSIIKGRSLNIKNKTLKKHKRQYVGFVNEKNEIIIYINFLKDIDKEQKTKLKKELLWILDGGDNYWQIFVNIDSKELFGLFINAVS